MTRPAAVTLVAALVLTTSVCLATPSTLVWIPSTDVQAVRTWHFGVDNLFTLGTPAKQATDCTDIGLTYGLARNLEVGIDLLSGMSDPLFFNAKYALGPFGAKDEWSVAVGAYGLGLEDTVSQDIWYGLVSYRCGQDRLHLGYFTGAGHVLTDPFTGADESAGILLGWDRPLADRWWAGVDYQGGRSAVGALSLGVAYSVSETSSVLLGASFWNNGGIANALTFQYDLDL
jgi:hypothetical protein